MELAVFGLICAAIGAAFGYVLKGEGKKAKVEAPAPDYDVGNPINARGHRGEVVEICGAEFVRVN